MNAMTHVTDAITNASPLHARFDGPIVMIGFGSIGKGTLPLIERHIGFDRNKFVVIAPEDADRGLLDERDLRFIHAAITKENYREVLTPLLTTGPGRGMIVNLSVDTSSVDLIEFAKDVDAFYIDTVIEPWPGHYTDRNLSIAARSNYALRESLLALRRRRPGGVTAVSCCGANPGMVSWLVKQALVDVATELGLEFDAPKTRDDWARLMQRAGVKGVHIAERDTQRARNPKPRGVFVNTWSVEGFVSEGLQPAELGWGTHEKTLPAKGRRHDSGCDAAIYLTQPGAGTRVRSWTPTAQAQHAFLITHNEAISIADYFTLRQFTWAKASTRTARCASGRPATTPTTRATTPCCQLHEMAGAAWRQQPEWKILGREGHRRRHRRARRPALRPRQKRLLVRLAALHRRGAAARAVPERDRNAGHLGRARRHRLDAGKSRPRHRRGRRDGFPALPRGPAALSRAGHRPLHRLDAGRRPRRAVPRRGRPRGSLAVQQRPGARLIIYFRCLGQ